MNQAAADLVLTCPTETFAVSFLLDSISLRLPEGRCRIYLENAAAADAASLAAQVNAADPAAQVVFLADSHDTRYEAYGILRPITDAESLPSA